MLILDFSKNYSPEQIEDLLKGQESYIIGTFISIKSTFRTEK
jgi:hypothetical protein